MTDLGTLGGGYIYAYGINNSGQVVGVSTNDALNQNYRAFLYSDGTMIDLGTLGGDSSAARGINEAGQIVGISTIAGGNHSAFIDTLNPTMFLASSDPTPLLASSVSTPLPTTFLLFGSGLLGLLALGRRKWVLKN